MPRPEGSLSRDELVGSLQDLKTEPRNELTGELAASLAHLKEDVSLQKTVSKACKTELDKMAAGLRKFVQEQLREWNPEVTNALWLGHDRCSRKWPGAWSRSWPGFSRT